MKILYRWALALSCVLLFAGCNDEWKNEQYKQYLSFVNNGVNRVYFKYAATGGKKSYRVPVELSGSQTANRDVNVSISLDTDTLENYNYNNYHSRSDLFFKELDKKHYTIKTHSVVIPRGEVQGYVDIDFSFEGLDNYDKYILPLQIDASSDNLPNPYKFYSKSLMHIIVFNDYSGKYVVTDEMTELDANNNPIGDKIKVETRNSWVVDENTIFFYAGLTEEESLARKDYRIYAKFIKGDDSSGRVELTAENPAIGLQSIPDQCYYVIQSVPDEVQPFLLRKRVMMNVSYSYLDLSNSQYPLRYRYSGPMINERVLNTLKPEEDQIVFE